MRRASLFYKYALPLVLMVAGALIVSGLVEIYFSYQDSKAALGRLQQEKAQSAAIRIEQFVRELEQQLAWVAQTPWGTRSLSLHERRLECLRLLRQAPAIMEVSLIDPSGHEQVRVSRLAMDVTGSNLDRSQEPSFTQARARNTYFSPVYFRKESEPYMTIALAGDGIDAGVVAAEANLKLIWDVVSNMKVGEQGYAYVVDGQGRLIAHPDISLVLQKTDLSKLPQLRATTAADASSGKAIGAVIGQSPDGKDVVSAYAAIAPLGWLVFVDLPLAEALDPLLASALRTAVLLLIGLGVSVIASLVLMRRLIAPIQTLQTSAARIGAGALDQRIQVSTGDELQALGDEFNRMAERLQESYAGLERKVDERTRELREALEQQTATSEVLRVISASPTDTQPVFDTIVRSATRLCDASFAVLHRYDGSTVTADAWHNLRGEELDVILRVFPRPAERTYVSGRAILDRDVQHVPDIRTDPEYHITASLRTAGYSTVLAVPLLRDGNPIGALCLWRRAVAPFTQSQVTLVRTFADQAVIAIENVRLFQELDTRSSELARSVEQLKALSEVSQAVNSTLDLQQVLTNIVARAVQLSATDSGAVYEYDEPSESLQLRATYGVRDELAGALLSRSLRLGEGATGKAAQQRAPYQVPDLRETSAYEGGLRGLLDQVGFRGVLAVPLLREGRILGGLVVSRTRPGAYADEAVELLQTFAAQSALAIQNARLFREIEQKSRELEIASRHKSQFLANMSHELRTPLNAILGYTELIVDRIYGDVPEKILDVLERVQSSGRHLLGLINDVLDLSKIEAGQLALSLSDYSLQEVVQSVVASVEPLAAEKQLQLSVDVAGDLPVGRADERRIRQVLLNLVGNAIKFTDAGQVSIIVANPDSRFVLSVSDTGPGIPEDQRGRIFEEFQQVDGSSTRRKGGTGLGLAISKRIVEMHGGRIWVESAMGLGSTFFFSVPVRTERQEPLR